MRKKLININKKYNSRQWPAPLLSFAGIVLFWEGVVFWGGIKPYILPSPSRILLTLWEIFPMLVPHIIVTLKEFSIGFIVAVMAAVLIALIMDCFPKVKKGFYPLLVVSQTVPIIYLAPLFIIWFGYGILPKILVVSLVCFFPVAISLLEGLAAVDPEIIKVLRSMGAGKLQLYRLAKIPAALPSFFAGLKISAAYSIMGAIIAEWLGAMQGLGYFMTISQNSFKVDRVFAGILVVTALSLAVFIIVGLLERLAIPWRKVEVTAAAVPCRVNVNKEDEL